MNLPPEKKKKHTIRDPFDLWSLDSFGRYHSKKVGTKTVTCPKKVEDLVQIGGGVRPNDGDEIMMIHVYGPAVRGFQFGRILGSPQEREEGNRPRCAS